MSFEEVIELYKKTFYIEDISPLAIIASIIISYRLKTPPVWLYLIGPSSGGKSQYIEAFSSIPFVTQVSDLTTNTFLSGMINSREETSLLRRLGPEFVITMKDFTTILSKSDETQEAIIAQMREIYDGYISKYTGNGKLIEWGGDGKEGRPKGKATFIMAATEAIFVAQDKFADMGTRAINYVLVPQDRKKTCKRAMQNHNGLSYQVQKIQEAMNQFITEKVQAMPYELPGIEEELEDEIIEIADFATICRSVVKRDYKGAKSLALSAEYPMRMAHQLLALTKGFIYLYDGKLPDYLRKATFKVALDSIPKQRRLILEVLAKYNKVNKSGIADYINYSPERTEEWLEDLNMFGIVQRVKGGHKQYWRLKAEYRDIMKKYLGIDNTGVDLDIDSDGEAQAISRPGNFEDITLDADLSYEAVEEKEEANRQANIDWEKFGEQKDEV